jgi:TonB-dependent receptor
VTNPASWQINSTWAQGNEIDAGLDTLAANGRYELKWRAFSALHFGLRHGERSFDYDAYKYLAPITPAGMCASETQRLYYFKDSGIVDFCTAPAGADQYSVLQPITFAAVPQYVGTFNDFDPVTINGIGNGLPAIDPRAMDDPVAFQNALYPGNERYLQPADSYRVKETSESAYVMANFEGSTGSNGIPFAGNIGLRVVDTDIDITSFQTTAAQFLGNPAEWNGVNAPLGEDQINNSYRDWLPSANISFDIAEDMKMRYAYARTVARQDLPDLGRGLVVFYRANEGDNPSLPPTAQLFLSGRAGNPNLEPWRSDNFNAAYEWYFRDASLFSATVFLMQVDSFLTSITSNEPQPDADGVVREGGPVTRVANGDGGSIHGFELGYQQAFDFLPGIFGGLGTALNYTYSDAQTGGEDIEGNGLPIGDNSKHQVNAVLWYQQRGIQARVAYNWRSKRYSSTNDPSGVDPLAIWNRSVGYLDASTSYDITPNFTVYLQGVNLTGENEARYAQWENQFYDQSIFERRYFFGVRFRN